MRLCVNYLSPRVCRPEQYRIKYIVYRTLIGCIELLKASESDMVPDQRESPSNKYPSFNLSKLVKETDKIISLFDLILCEEISNDHARLPTILTAEQSCNMQQTPGRLLPHGSAKTLQPNEVKSTSCNLACDFCGSDIFQSFFECTTCSVTGTGGDKPDNNTTPTVTLGDGVLLCPQCYVEGRTCACGRMGPGQCRPFQALIDTRNEAVSMLRKSAPECKLLAQSAGCVPMNISLHSC